MAVSLWLMLLPSLLELPNSQLLVASDLLNLLLILASPVLLVA